MALNPRCWLTLRMIYNFTNKYSKLTSKSPLGSKQTLSITENIDFLKLLHTILCLNKALLFFFVLMVYKCYRYDDYISCYFCLHKMNSIQNIKHQRYNNENAKCFFSKWGKYIILLCWCIYSLNLLCWLLMLHSDAQSFLNNKKTLNKCLICKYRSLLYFLIQIIVSHLTFLVISHYIFTIRTREFKW